MNTRIKRLQERARLTGGCYDSGADSIYRLIRYKCQGKSEEVIHAECIKEYFNKRAIKIEEDELLVGSNAVTAPVQAVEIIRLSEEVALPMPHQHTEGKGLWAWAGNHSTVDYDYLLKNGFIGLRNKILNKLDVCQTEYIQGLLTTCDAIINLSNRYSELCFELGKAEENIMRKDELLKLSKICQKVPQYPAENFHEAIQALWFTFYLFGDGVGCVDRYLYPYYKKDLENNQITPQQALELIECFYIKVFNVLGSEHPRSADNHMVLGGLLSHGEDGFNEVTELVLIALEELELWRPQITFRWHDGVKKEDFLKVVKTHAKRFDRLMFINDEVVIKGLENLGVSYEDAVGYSLSGCNETIITGRANMGSVEGFFNLLKVLEILLGTDKTIALKRVISDEELYTVTNFETFLELFYRQLEENLGMIFDLSYWMDKERSKITNFLQSIVIDGCIVNEKSYTQGGAKYNFCNWCVIGFVNLVDSLSMIKQFVFEEKRFTLNELVLALENNWSGYEQIKGMINNKGKFFGNNEESVDSIAVKLAEKLFEIALKEVPYRGGKYTFGTLAGVENMHTVFGALTGATPDGRAKSEFFEASICASKSKKGILATLKSIAKIDFTNLPASVVVNISLEQRLSQNEDDLKRVAAMIETYFKLGGVHLQINYISAEELKKAQETPEKYEDLRVRVTGYSGFFTQLEKDVQEEIINRGEQHL